MEKEMFSAIKKNNFKVIEEILEINPNLVNVPNEDGVSPLTYAIANKSFDIVGLLGENGANLAYDDKRTIQDLHLAVIQGSLKVVWYLISCGVDVNQIDSNGKTPLHYSCKQDDEKITKLLLDHGANVNAVDNAGNVPAIIAMMYFGLCPGNLRYCIQYGADLTVVNKRGQSVLNIANSAALFTIDYLKNLPKLTPGYLPLYKETDFEIFMR